MAADSPTRRRLSARIAAVERHRGPADPEAAELRGQLAAEGLADHIRAVVDAWPPLTPEQRNDLALLLSPGAGAHGT